MRGLGLEKGRGPVFCQLRANTNKTKNRPLRFSIIFSILLPTSPSNFQLDFYMEGDLYTETKQKEQSKPKKHLYKRLKYNRLFIYDQSCLVLRLVLSPNHNPPGLI